MPCFNFKGDLWRAAARELRGNFKTQQHWQPWPTDIPFSLLCSNQQCMQASKGESRHHYNNSQCCESNLAVLHACSYFTPEKYHIMNPRINNSTLFLDTWLLPVFLSFKAIFFMKARKAPSVPQGHRVLQLQELWKSSAFCAFYSLYLSAILLITKY